MAGLDLGKQVGPLPLGGWLVVIAGGLGIGYVINRNMAKGNATAENESSTQLTESGVGGGGGPQFVYTPPTSGSGDTAPETNQTWGLKVKNWLIAQNHSPTIADNAVRKYLGGLPLSLSETALINLALIQFGAPPDDIPVVDQPDVPPTEDLVPVTNLHVNRWFRTNNVLWQYNNPKVTHFQVVAHQPVTGTTAGATIPAIPGQTTYSWVHVTAPSTNAANAMHEYTVTPFIGSQAGPASKVNAAHLVTT